MVDPSMITSAASGLLNAGVGIWQTAKANKMLKGMQYPTMSIPSAIKQNKGQAELDAAVGTPSEQYNQAMKNIQRNQMQALRAGMDRNAAGGMVAALNDNINTATGNLDANDAAARIANKRNLQDVNTGYGNWQQSVWQNNIKDKYDRDYNYAMSLKGQGMQNLMGGVDKIASSGMSMLGKGAGGAASGLATSVMPAGNGLPRTAAPIQEYGAPTTRSFGGRDFSLPNFRTNSPYPYPRPQTNFMNVNYTGY